MDLLTQGIGNRVVGRHNSQIFDMGIDEALAMPRVFDYKLYDTVNRLTVKNNAYQTGLSKHDPV